LLCHQAPRRYRFHRPPALSSARTAWPRHHRQLLAQTPGPVGGRQPLPLAPAAEGVEHLDAHHGPQVRVAPHVPGVLRVLRQELAHGRGQILGVNGQKRFIHG
jgi:hypothetical protein